MGSSSLLRSPASMTIASSQSNPASSVNLEADEVAVLSRIVYALRQERGRIVNVGRPHCSIRGMKRTTFQSPPRKAISAMTSGSLAAVLRLKPISKLTGPVMRKCLMLE